MSTSFWPTIIMLMAVALMCMELFIPSGGVLSVLAGIAFLGSIVVAFMQGGVGLGTLFMAIACSVIPLVLFLFIKFWPKTPIGRRILIQPPPEDELVPDDVKSLRDFVGHQGTALTPMLPSGAIRLSGQTIDAVSEGMSIDKGALVKVVAARKSSRGSPGTRQRRSPESSNVEAPRFSRS